jgi:hypothetical protein
MHRRTQRLPALQGDRHHEPPLVTTPPLLLPVLGAAVAAGTLLVVELWLDEVDVVLELAVVVLSAVLDDVVFPAYEAAAA